jgi:hypothetical protein
MKVKDRMTYAVIGALLLVVVVIPLVMFLSENILPPEPQSIKDYCRANGFREVFGCDDGSFKAIRERFGEGFRQVYPDGTYYDCPFTLPEYQEGECKDFVVPGFCTDDDICLDENSCLSDIDCGNGEKCIGWKCDNQ